ncbi:hypothetical protein TorRG33x02_144810, partial [Trema orientale]
MPPPPPGLDQTSSLNRAPPSAASMARQTLSWASLIIFSKRALTEDEDDAESSRRNVSGLWASGVSFSIDMAEWITRRRRSGLEIEGNRIGEVSVRLGRNAEEEDDLGLFGEEEEEEIGEVKRENEDEAEREIEAEGGIFSNSSLSL